MATPFLRALLTKTRKSLLLPTSQLALLKPFSSHTLKPSLNPSISLLPSSSPWLTRRFCTHSDNSSVSPSVNEEKVKGGKKKSSKKSRFDFTKIDSKLLPTVILVGRPNVGKSALFNRLIRRREALVYNTPGDHVTRDIREGIAKLGDLRFRVLDSAGLETAATSGTILSRTAEMTSHVLSRSQFAIFLIDIRSGLQPLDTEVGQFLRKHAPKLKPIILMNKSESLEGPALLTAVSGEAHKLGFGDPIAISAETGLGMAELYEVLRPLFEDYMDNLKLEKKEKEEDQNGDKYNSEDQIENENEDEELVPLQLAIVGRPNVGKSTLLNTLLQQKRVLVGPESGLTRDSIRAQFHFQNRTIYLVDTAGWLERSGREKGPGSLSIVQSRKNLMRAHIVSLVLDAQEIARSKTSMNHAEVKIGRQAVEEGRGLIIIVNKMDLLNSNSVNKVMEIVPQEIQTVIPQVSGIPVVFISALEGRGRIAVMRQVVDLYEKWCLRLSTAKLNRWLIKVMSRHSWKDSSTQPKIKYFTQVKARPPTFVAFLSGKVHLSETDLRFLTKSLKEDFDLGGIPIRVMQRVIVRKQSNRNGKSNSNGGRVVFRSLNKVALRRGSDKRSEVKEISET